LKKREIPLAGQTRAVWVKQKKSPWRGKLGPMGKASDREIPLAGQTRANGKSHKEIPLEKKVGFVVEINH
jgi:hypothetical protein